MSGKLLVGATGAVLIVLAAVGGAMAIECALMRRMPPEGRVIRSSTGQEIRVGPDERRRYRKGALLTAWFPTAWSGLIALVAFEVGTFASIQTGAWSAFGLAVLGFVAWIAVAGALFARAARRESGVGNDG